MALAFVAEQLHASPAALRDYGARSQTRTEHLQQIQRYLGFRDPTLPDSELRTAVFRRIPPNNNVFAGRLVNGPILISEQRPAGGARQGTITMPNLYPGTQGSTGYVIRATRATIHLGVIVAILYMMYAAGLLIVSSDS
jgi:Domain of unknown function (DUF4158)